MNPKCVQAVAQVLGRVPSKATVQAIDDRMQATMRSLARTDPAWQSYSRDQRVQMAAETAARDLQADARKAADRRTSNVIAQARETQRLNARAAELAQQGRKNPYHQALFERMRNMDDYVSGIRNESLSNMIDAIEAVSPKLLGLMDNPERVREFAKAVIDGDKSVPEMAAAAKAYLNAMEQMRLRANAAGTDIGQLDYGYVPQIHDVGRIARAGRDTWVQDVMPALDRTRYIRTDGSPMGDLEVASLLQNAYETITTEGRNKMTPGQQGAGSRAGGFDEKHRSIHFANADAYLNYLQDYGRSSMMTAIHQHVGQMSKTIGMLEEFGANPNNTFRLLKDTAEKADNVRGARQSFANLDQVWDTLSGVTGQPVSPQLAQFWQGIRNYTTAAKLGGVMLSAITDAPLQVLVARSNGIPTGSAIASLFAGYGKAAREEAHALGVGLDEVAGEMARWHQDNLAQGWSSKLANSTMRLTLVEGWTNAMRRGFAFKLMNTMDRMRGTDWADLSPYDRNRFTAGGMSETDWKVYQMAQPTLYRDAPMLTKEGIAGIPLADLHAAGLTGPDAVRATTRLLGYLDQEAKTAVLAPDLQTRAAIQQGTKSGTVGGEVLRSLMLFKSFGLAIVDKHVRRIRMLPDTQSKVAYSVAMLTSLTLFGALSNQLKAVVQGKDPLDMTKPAFWAASFMTGGGFGIYGDILYTGMGGNAKGGQANWTGLAGPVFGNMMDLAQLSLGYTGALIAAKNASQRRTANRQAAGNAIRYAKGNLPLINLWYTRAAVDHMLLNDMQESVSPGYLRRMKQNARRDYGTTWWWEPGQAAPDRAPNLNAATGSP